MTTPTKQYACGNIDCGAVFVYGAMECGKFREPRFCPDCGTTFAQAPELAIVARNEAK